MAKAKKIRRLQGTQPPGARGRTAQTTAQATSEGKNGAVAREHWVDVNRPQSAGGGKVRGDRRDTNKTYTTNIKHPARGNNARPDVSTRKR
ncbi:MAG TPA: hypothetical protein VF669_06445 [Tepidisphaeraceae bacterium]|jgi:hypothetical protein